MSEPRRAFSEVLLEKGVASQEQLELCIASQALYGGDLTTTLVDSGILEEGALSTLFAEHMGMDNGPEGKLADPSPHVSGLLPPEVAARHHLYPVGRTQNALEVAVCDVPDEEVTRRIASSAGLEVALVAVLPHRLAEALASYAGLPLSDRVAWLVGMLNAGENPTVDSMKEGMRQRIESAYPVTTTYRRMSLHPEGIVPSSRQAKPPSEEVPETLDGVPTVREGDGAPGSKRLKRTLDPADSSAEFTSEPPESADDPGRITRPYAEEEGEEGEKRDTQPWRDDDVEDAPPVSVSGEFKASLSEAPPSAEARILEEHRRFRHRGPFTRPQAELAASQASDVQMVLEILTRYARQFFERSVLFVVSGNRAELRFAHGLALGLAMLSLNLDEEPSVLRDAHIGGDPVVRGLERDGVDAILRNKLNILGEERVTVIPLAIRERVVALFYGDDRSDGVDRDAVADVTDFIEICASEITRIIISRKRDSHDV